MRTCLTAYLSKYFRTTTPISQSLRSTITNNTRIAPKDYEKPHHRRRIMRSTQPNTEPSSRPSAKGCVERTTSELCAEAMKVYNAACARQCAGQCTTQCAIVTVRGYLSNTSDAAPSAGLWSPRKQAQSTPHLDNSCSSKLWSLSTTSDSASCTVRLIGAGTCGRIYHLLNDATKCLKREKDHHFTGRGLLNDYSMHQRIYSTFSQAPPVATTNIHVPQPFTFFAKADISLKTPHWATLHAQFPANDQ